jgi:hypothetical protein
MRLANRPAHLLITPFRLMNRPSGASIGLCSSAYRRARDHLDRVRLSTFAGSAVQRMGAAIRLVVVGSGAFVDN